MMQSFISFYTSLARIYTNTRRDNIANRIVSTTVALLMVAATGGVLYGQDTSGDPTSATGDYNGFVTTAGAYDAFTGNAKRVVTDIVVPGANGEYPLAFTRTASSRTVVYPFNLRYFADGGNWKHNYEWLAITSTPGGGVNATYGVYYPDGRVISFQIGGGDSPSGDPYARGPIGTNDQLEIDPNSAYLKLHMADGGIVRFNRTTNYPYSGITPGTVYRADSITDRYGAVTTLDYSAQSTGYSYLTKVTEPGGRSLNLVYDTIRYTDANGAGYVWNVLRRVTYSTGSTTQTVTYNYGSDNNGANPIGSNGTYYEYLSNVVYNQEASTAGGYVTAKYNYWGHTGDPNYKPLPLLANCDDPHYAGPMTRIQYLLNAGDTGIWGFLQSEVSFPRQGEPPTTYNVSTLTQGQGSTFTWSTDTRGDYADSSNTSISRTFKYGEDKTTPAQISTSAKGFQPTTVIDYEGNPTCIFYNTQASGCGRGFVRQIIDANGRITQFTTEPYVGQITKVILPDQRTRSTVWQNVNGNTTTNGFKTDGTTPCTACTLPYYIFKTIDEHGLTTVYHRNSTTGHLFQVDYADGSNEFYSYQQFTGVSGTYEKILSYTSRLGAVMNYTYGSDHGGSGRSDLLTSVSRTYTDVNNASHTESTRYYYDSLDRVYKVIDPGNVTDRYAFNGRHQRTQVFHEADNTHIDYTYDDYGRQTSVSDELGETFSTSYDSYGRPISVTRPVYAYGISSVTTQFLYNRYNNSNVVIGQAMSHTSSQFGYKIMPSGRAEQHCYSPNGWLRDSYLGQNAGSLSNPYFTQCIDETGSIQYDATGHMLQSTDAEGLIWKRSYDNCGRLFTSTDPLGHVTTWNYYQPNQQVVGGIDYAGWLRNTVAPGADLLNFPTATTSYTSYDANGHATGWTDPYNHNFASTYNASGELTSQSDGVNTTSYKYDQLGRKKKVGYPDNTTKEQWTYYPGGMVYTYTNRAGAVCTYHYDGRNRISSYDWNDGATAWTAYTFDAANHLLGVQNPSADIKYTPDQSGGITAESELISGQSARLTTTYNRDVDGHIISIKYPSNDWPGFSYDSQGRCSGVIGGSNWLSQYSYYGDWLTGIWRANGNYTKYEYQNSGRVADLWHYRAANSSGAPVANGSIDRRVYGYAPDGQISWFDRENDVYDGVHHQSGSNLENGRGNVFLYWPDGSLGAAYQDYARASSWPNAYQPTGDARVDPSTLITSGGTNTYYDSYTYDAAGNRTQVTQLNPPENLNYGTADSDDRYAQWSLYDANSNTKDSLMGWTYYYDAEGKMTGASGPYGAVVSFSYDGLGRMVAQNNNGVGTFFYYAGNQRIEERNFSNNPVYQYFYAAPGSDQILFRQDTTNGRLWYLSDVMGNTTHLVNNSGQVIEQYLYDAYGVPSFYDYLGNPLPYGSNYDNRYLFGGSSAYEWLSAPELYYCRSRFYLPVHGRWLQPDPIGQDGGLNIYSYCGNDPINGTDPSGQSFFSFISSIFHPSDGNSSSDNQYQQYDPTSDPSMQGADSGGDAYGPGGFDRKGNLTVLPDKFTNFSAGISEVSNAGLAHMQNGSFGGSLSGGTASGRDTGEAPVYNWRTNYRVGAASDADNVFAAFHQDYGNATQTITTMAKVAAWGSVGGLGVGVIGAATEGLPTMGFAVGPGQPFHVAFSVGTRMLHATGSVLCTNTFRITAMAGAAETFEQRYFGFELPVLYPDAVAATAGTTANSCATGAAYAFFKGWGW